MTIYAFIWLPKSNSERTSLRLPFMACRVDLVFGSLSEWETSNTIKRRWSELDSVKEKACTVAWNDPSASWTTQAKPMLWSQEGTCIFELGLHKLVIEELAQTYSAFSKVVLYVTLASLSVIFICTFLQFKTEVFGDWQLQESGDCI